MPDSLRAMLMTAEKYDALHPDVRVELVDGVLQIRPTPTRRHQVVVQKLRAGLESDTISAPGLSGASPAAWRPPGSSG